jgi:hypothetical protein
MVAVAGLFAVLAALAVRDPLFLEARARATQTNDRMMALHPGFPGAAAEALRVPAKGIDYRLLETEDGAHGAWSVQAEIALAQRKGVRVPGHVAALQGRFPDLLEGS